MNKSPHTLRRAVTAGLAVVLLAGAGCISTTGTTATREANRREDYLLVTERMRRMEGDIESLRMQIDLLAQDLRRIQANAATSADSQAASVQAALAEIQARMQDLENRRETDRREIVDTLSRKVAELVNAQPAPAARQPAGGGSGYAYEHIVQAGETMSRIAQAYGTTVSAILQANGLQNADTLRVGQRLLVPE